MNAFCTTQTEEEVQRATDIRKAVLYFLQWTFNDQRGGKQGNHFLKMFGQTFETWYTQAKEVGELEVNPKNVVPYILGYATLRNINIDIMFSIIFLLGSLLFILYHR